MLGEKSININMDLFLHYFGVHFPLFNQSQLSSGTRGLLIINLHIFKKNPDTANYSDTSIEQ